MLKTIVLFMIAVQCKVLFIKNKTVEIESNQATKNNNE